MRATSKFRQPDLGAILRTLRHEKKWSQERLALEVGMKPSEVSHLESGRRNPKVGTLQRLAGGLGVPYSAILVLTEELESRASKVRAQDIGKGIGSRRVDDLHRQVRRDFLVALELEGVVTRAAEGLEDPRGS